MPGRRCAVSSCNNSRFATKRTNPEIAYHNFPKGNDSDTISVRKDWIRRCKRADQWNPATSQICSVHFTDNDYERDMRNELLGLAVRRLLKRNAVPTLQLDQEVEETTFHKKKLVAGREGNGKKEIEEIWLSAPVIVAEDVADGAESIATDPLSNCADVKSEGVAIKSAADKSLQRKYNKVLEENRKLRMKILNLNKKCRLQAKQLEYYKKKEQTKIPPPLKKKRKK